MPSHTMNLPSHSDSLVQPRREHSGKMRVRRAGAHDVQGQAGHPLCPAARCLCRHLSGGSEAGVSISERRSCVRTLSRSG
jgi:hypothetical protein